MGLAPRVPPRLTPELDTPQQRERFLRHCDNVRLSLTATLADLVGTRTIPVAWLGEQDSPIFTDARARERIDGQLADNYSLS